MCLVWGRLLAHSAVPKQDFGAPYLNLVPMTDVLTRLTSSLAGHYEVHQGSAPTREAISLNAYDLSAGVFVRGLTNLKTQLTKAEDHAATSGIGEAALLDARLAADAQVRGVASIAPADLHMYTLAAQVHWAAEGARLAIARLLGASRVPAANEATSFSDLYQRLDETVAYLGEIAPSDLAAGLDRSIVVEHRRGSVQSSGSQFLLAFAIPHFFYHVASAYGILRNQGVQLTMGDFLGNWGT